MSVFSVESILTQKIIKNLINMNYHVIIDELIQKKNNKDIQKKEIRNEIKLKEEIKDIQKNIVSLSLIHPKNCQPKIPIKDSCSLFRPYLKTMDDIFDIQSAINSIFSNSEDIEYKNIHPYYKWECENDSEKYGYTHFLITVSLINEKNESYYAIEVIRISGTKLIIHIILNELTERLNILL